MMALPDSFFQSRDFFDNDNRDIFDVHSSRKDTELPLRKDHIDSFSHICPDTYHFSENTKHGHHIHLCNERISMAFKSSHYD